MVGLEGYAPSTSPMSMGHSTIELKSLLIIYKIILILLKVNLSKSIVFEMYFLFIELFKIPA